MLQVHILEFTVGPFIFRGPALVLHQCTISLPSLWFLFTYLLVLISGLGRALLPNILLQNN